MSNPLGSSPVWAAANRTGLVTVLQVLAQRRVIPVVVLDDPRAAKPLAEALTAGGLPLVEVTFRTDNAEQVVRAMAEDPALMVGAGTVTSARQVDAAVAAGAEFVVSPGFSGAVITRCRQLDILVIPGVATATELMAVLGTDITTVKLFPAEPLGGISTLRALAAVFPQVRFVPTGGISAANAEEDFTASLGFEVPRTSESLTDLQATHFQKMIDAVTAEFANLRVVATTLRTVRSATINDWGALAWSDDDGFVHATDRPGLEVLDRVGGDSFASGLIYGLLQDAGLLAAVEYGAAHGALAMTTPGDASMASLTEVLRLAGGAGARAQR